MEGYPRACTRQDRSHFSDPSLSVQGTGRSDASLQSIHDFGGQRARGVFFLERIIDRVD